MFKLKNISTKVLYLYRFDTLEKVTLLPNEIIEVLNINEYINLEGLLDPSKNILIIL